METLGDKLVVATNTQANLGRRDSTPFDTGTRGFTIIPHSQIIAGNPPSLTIHLPRHMIPVNQWFGGIPLTGYNHAKVMVRTRGTVHLKIAEQDPSINQVIAADEYSSHGDRLVIELDKTLNYPIFKIEKASNIIDVAIILS